MITAQDYKNSIKVDTIEIKLMNEDLKNNLGKIIEKYEKAYEQMSIDLESIYNKLKTGETVVFPQPISLDSNNDPIVTRTTAHTTTTTAPSTPTINTPPVISTTTATSSSETEIMSEFDERLSDNFITGKKYAIGFVHFKNEKKTNSNVFTISKDTTSENVVNFLKSLINDDLLIGNQLNMKFKPEIRNTESDYQYEFFNNSTCSYNESYIQFIFNSKRFSNLFRVNNIVSVDQKLTISANKNYNKKSDYFNINNPFNDDFRDNLPLILSPRNAGIFNTFASEIGETSSLGIIDRIGRIKNAVPVIMRPSHQERFTIDFLTTDLTNKYPIRDYVLYFHFNVDSI